MLPTFLGADALGGAINLVTKSGTKSFGEASYEIGSFNTHRVSLNGLYKSKNEKFFAGIDGFFNYSENNYGADVRVLDDNTGVTKDAHVNLFHNQFKNYYAEAFPGISNTKWADELKLTITHFSIDKQFQFGTTMDKPFGAARGTQQSFSPSVLYKKQLLHDKLNINQFFAINTLRVETIDTLKGHYDWYGKYTPNAPEHGELSGKGSLSYIDFRIWWPRYNKQKKPPRVVVKTDTVVAASGWKYTVIQFKKGLGYGGWSLLGALVLGALYGVFSGIVLQPAGFALIFVIMMATVNLLISVVVIIVNSIFLVPLNRSSYSILRYFSWSFSYWLIFFAGYLLLITSGLIKL